MLKMPGEEALGCIKCLPVFWGSLYTLCHYSERVATAAGNKISNHQWRSQDELVTWHHMGTFSARVTRICTHPL